MSKTLEKTIQRLIEKYLLKDITRITIKVFGEKFDEVFNESCKLNSERNTTIGHTFEKIQHLALVDVVDFMVDKLEDINLTKSMSKENPFKDFLWDLWDEAKEHFYFEGYVESILADEWHDKQVELTKAGILNQDGDYLKQ